MRPRFFNRYLVAAAVLAVVATSCSSPATTKQVLIKPTTNQGLCKLVGPSVIATVLSANMAFPTTLTHGSTTECVYRAKGGTSTAALIRYDTDANASTFGRSVATFEHHGLKLGPIAGLGDQAYYLYQQAGHSKLTTVVLLKGSLQLLVTGTGILGQIGPIARYALSQYEATHAKAAPASGS